MSPMEREVRYALKVMKEYSVMLKARCGGRYPFPRERDTIIVWGMYNGWSDAQIAKSLGLRASTIRKVKASYESASDGLLRLPLILQRLKGLSTIWVCGFCIAKMETSERKALTHAKQHFMPHGLG